MKNFKGGCSGLGMMVLVGVALAVFSAIPSKGDTGMVLAIPAWLFIPGVVLVVVYTLRAVLFTGKEGMATLLTLVALLFGLYWFYSSGAIDAFLVAGGG